MSSINVDQVFFPDLSVRVNNVSATAQAVTLPVRGSGSTLLVTNEGSETILVTFGNATLTTVTDANGMPILPYTQVPLKYPKSITRASVKVPSGTGIVTFTSGAGL